MRFYKRRDVRDVRNDAVGELDLAPNREAPNREAPNREEGRGASSPTTSFADRTWVAEELMQALGDIPGTLGLALIEPETGEILGSAARGVDMAVVATLHIDLCRTASRIADLVSDSGAAEDLAVTLGSQHQLIAPLSANPATWLSIVLDRQRGNVALARHQVSKIEGRLTA